MAAPPALSFVGLVSPSLGLWCGSRFPQGERGGPRGLVPAPPAPAVPLGAPGLPHHPPTPAPQHTPKLCPRGQSSPVPSDGRSLRPARAVGGSGEGGRALAEGSLRRSEGPAGGRPAPGPNAMWTSGRAVRAGGLCAQGARGSPGAVTLEPRRSPGNTRGRTPTCAHPSAVGSDRMGSLWARGPPRTPEVRHLLQDDGRS